MILNSKQLEELESIHDSAIDFEDDAADGGEEAIDESADSALAWRRGMLEKAAANVRKAFKKPVDPQNSYALGTLLYDRQTKKFGRVSTSTPNLLKLVYLSGTEGEIKKAQLEEVFLPEERHNKELSTAKEDIKTVKEAKKKTVPVNKSKAKVLPETKSVKALAPAKTAVVNEKSVPANKKAVVSKLIKKKATLKTVTKSKSAQKSVKAKKPVLKSKVSKIKPVKKSTHTKPTPKHAISKTSKKTTKQSASYVSHANISDPIADPNGYIKQHFQLMSNKELANVTGLSEHTIRRKLGEWGLKRVK